MWCTHAYKYSSFERGVTQIWSLFYFKTHNFRCLRELGIIFSIGLQCMCIEQVKTETNLFCLNTKNCLIKLKNLSCVFMSSAWTNHTTFKWWILVRMCASHVGLKVEHTVVKNWFLQIRDILKDRPSCSLPFNVLTLTTCSVKTFTHVTDCWRTWPRSVFSKVGQVRQTSITHLLPFDWLWYKTFRILLISCMRR
jgi:hypothetical protein